MSDEVYVLTGLEDRQSEHSQMSPALSLEANCKSRAFSGSIHPDSAWGWSSEALGCHTHC